jgi:protein-export membrane protein SecD
MLQIPRWRIVVVAIATVLGILFALPNVLPASLRANIPVLSALPPLNLGLDLRGGSHLLYEIDTKGLLNQELESVVADLERTLDGQKPRIPRGPGSVVDGAARVRPVNPEDVNRVLELTRKELIQKISTGAMGQQVDSLIITASSDGAIEARFSPERIEQMQRDGIAQSIEVIRQRIDPSGTSEVAITRQGENRIIVQAPGEADSEALKRRIGQTARMTFHLVEGNVTQDDLQSGRVPPGSEILPTKEGGKIAIKKRVELSGDNLTDARAQPDPQTGGFAVSMEFDQRGGRIFGRLTTQNVGKPFAIVLDGMVLSAPNIREPILGGSGQITGNFTAEEANELGVLLRAGALPAPLNIIEQRTVGAELGQDAINAGALAGVIAAIMILGFMLLAYGLFGLFACIALVINFVMIIGLMSVFGATLTMPGIAGIILTIAIAVDANVLIYERMRDEVMAGRGPAIALDAGFSRAIITIMDANLTTILAALILFQFGAGPVRGFAWTLSIGTATSVFTAVLVTQILLAWWFRTARPKSLPI